jgi:hypothetical protein
VKYSGVVPSTGRPRCESPSEIGTVQATARCAATACRLAMVMLLVAPPMRNTAYSISCTGPVRAPTTRSVPLTACEKLIAHVGAQPLQRQQQPGGQRDAQAAAAGPEPSVRLRRFQAHRTRTSCRTTTAMRTA